MAWVCVCVWLSTLPVPLPLAVLINLPRLPHTPQTLSTQQTLTHSKCRIVDQFLLNLQVSLPLNPLISWRFSASEEVFKRLVVVVFFRESAFEEVTSVLCKQSVVIKATFRCLNALLFLWSVQGQSRVTRTYGKLRPSRGWSHSYYNKNIWKICGHSEKSQAPPNIPLAFAYISAIAESNQ